MLLRIQRPNNSTTLSKAAGRNAESGIQSRPNRVGRPRWEERMKVGTLMAAVCRTHWVANARAFQEERAKGSETIFFVSCLMRLPLGARSAKEVKSLRRWPGETKAVQMRSCYLGVSCPGAWLRMQLSLPTPMPRRTDSVGSTVLEGSQRSSGCPRHIPTGCLKTAHTATLALLGT